MRGIYKQRRALAPCDFFFILPPLVDIFNVNCRSIAVLNIFIACIQLKIFLFKVQFAYTLDTLYERTYVLFIKIIEYKIFQDIALGY